MKRLLQGIVLCCACWLLPATATAQNLQAVSAWGILAYHDGFGIGARYLMPLGTTGLIQGAAVKDRFGLELGADFIDWSDSYHTYDYNYAALLPMVGVIWTFWLNPELALYQRSISGTRSAGTGTGTTTGGTSPTRCTAASSGSSRPASSTG